MTPNTSVILDIRACKSVKTHIVMISLILILLSIWFIPVNKNLPIKCQKLFNDYKKIALCLSIFAGMLYISVIVRCFMNADNEMGDIVNSIKVDVPEKVKCPIRYFRCDEGVINLATLLHFIMYFIIGMVIPNRYGAILIVSIVFEIIELWVGFPCKIILDPIVNMLGYFLGSMLHILIAF